MEGTQVLVKQQDNSRILRLFIRSPNLEIKIGTKLIILSPNWTSGAHFDQYLEVENTLN